MAGGYRQRGAVGLRPISWPPHRTRKREWPKAVTEEIRRLRTEHPNPGKRKIHPLLLRFCERRALRCPAVGPSDSMSYTIAPAVGAVGGITCSLSLSLSLSDLSSHGLSVRAGAPLHGSMFGSPVSRFFRTMGLCILVGVSLSGSEAFGYRFVSSYDDGSHIVDAESAARWGVEYWAAGTELEWFLADDSGWTDSWVDSDGETQAPPFESAAAAVPFVRKAMAVWSRIPTADIRWRLSGVASGPGVEKDDRNAITVRTNEEGFFGRANWWFRRRTSTAPWELVECDIELSPAAAARLGSRDRGSLSTTIHEFGHCLGLAHSAAHSWWAGAFDRDSGVWGETPKMSYGRDISNALSLDDIVAASLLRPAGGWRQRTGAVSGRMTVDGEPARFISVTSLRVAGRTAGPAPGVFTGADGRFRIEGLAPGQYLVGAGPMISKKAHPNLLERGAVLRAMDGVLLSPVTVVAGEDTGGVALNLPGERNGNDWIR